MSNEQFTREAALRIGLAARVLPDTEPARLMRVLVNALGLPITEDKLTRITVRQLTEAADGDLGQMPLPVIKQALDYLWGKATVELDDDLPPVEAYAEGDMPGSIRVAVASNGKERLDGHFGSCARFLIYQVSPTESRLVAIRGTEGAEASGDKNAYRADLIADCHLLYVMSIGGPAAAKVVKADVHPIKFPEAGEAREKLAELQQVLTGTPPPWLAKVMGKRIEHRFESAEEEA